MLGIIDVGGGLRGVFTAGIYDYLLDRGVQPFDYMVGVSAGSANLVSYQSRQRGRSLAFYTEYAFRKEYMSVEHWLKTGSYLNLDYIYTTLSGVGGESPVDLAEFNACSARYEVVVTDALTGEAVYYDKSEMAEGNFDVIKASCCVPGVCRPYSVRGRLGFDGGVADPVPYRRALAQGCDRLVLLLTRPIGYRRPLLERRAILEKAMRDWPESYSALLRRSERYNRDVAEVRKLEREGKALVVAPESIGGMSTLTRDKAAMERLYHMGYEQGERVRRFVEQI